MKTSVPEVGLSPCELLALEAPEVPQTRKAVSTAVGYIPDLDCKSPVLKTPCTLTAGHGETKLGLNWKFPP